MNVFMNQKKNIHIFSNEKFSNVEATYDRLFRFIFDTWRWRWRYYDSKFEIEFSWRMKKRYGIKTLSFEEVQIPYKVVVVS